MTKMGRMFTVVICGVAGGLKLFPAMVGLVAMATVLTNDLEKGFRFWAALAALGATYLLLAGLHKGCDLMLEDEKP